jgi:histidine phosphotransferase ChpT
LGQGRPRAKRRAARESHKVAGDLSKEGAMIEAPHMAAMVASKLCHDMIEPMNGMIHGLELLKETELAQRHPEALSLLDQGVNKAWAKLDLFRFAIGGALSEGDATLDEARELAERLYQHLKPELRWRAPPAPMPRAAVRVIANLLLIAADCLPRGGVVEIAAGAGEVRIAATGARALMKPATAAGLRGETPEGGFQGANIHPALTRLYAERAGVAIETRVDAERIELIARSAQIGAASAAA